VVVQVKDLSTRGHIRCTHLKQAKTCPSIGQCSAQSCSRCALWCQQVPEGHVWLHSTDSRHYGPVPYALLKGRAFCKVLTALGAACAEHPM
jgi:hypothetical protein